MMKQFSPDKIADMITHWHKQDLNMAVKFNYFYGERNNIYAAIQKKDYGWD